MKAEAIIASAISYHLSPNAGGSIPSVRKYTYPTPVLNFIVTPVKQQPPDFTLPHAERQIAFLKALCRNRRQGFVGQVCCLVPKGEEMAFVAGLAGLPRANSSTFSGH
ncbi:MAG: hypothetical protein J7576_18820 [Siphonobacter aquaeclarae]|nr:hypothetical protein [Siphonobacter aquaeclarae]